MTLRGKPDYGVVPYQLGVTGLDPALAVEFARFGFSRLDSKGRPYLFDDFRDGVQAWSIGGGANAKVTASILYAFGGSVVARLDRLTTPLTTIMSKTFPNPANPRAGLEFSLLFDGNTPNTFKASLSLDGSLHFLQITANRADNQFVVKSPSGDFATAVNPFSNWNQIKLTADFGSKKYLSLSIGSPATPITVFDLSAKSLLGPQGGLAMLQYDCLGDGASQTANIGYSIVTVDEP